MIGFDGIDDQSTWVLGRHPAISNGCIVKPIMFGSRVRVLPECEGGHVILPENVARLIAAAPNLAQALRPVAEIDLVNGCSPVIPADVVRNARIALHLAYGNPI